MFNVVSTLYVNRKSRDLHQWIALVSLVSTRATCLGTALSLGQHMHINGLGRPPPRLRGVQVYISRPCFRPSFSSPMLKCSHRVLAIASFRLLRVAEYRILLLETSLVFIRVLKRVCEYSGIELLKNKNN